MIRAYDAYGRELFIKRETWRTEVLPDALKQSWDNPDQLCATISMALQDRFAADLVEAAVQLRRIDPNRERAAVLLGVVYLESKRLAEAEDVFTTFGKEAGESPYILTNLAKVQSARGNNTLAQATLWRALELDPNQDNAFNWHLALQRDSGGEPAAREALRKLAALPRSWRARLWLAREAITARELDQALSHYREALELAERPVPTDLLVQMSGDLGNAAHLPELLELTVPHFEIAVHGLQVGNNLLKANLDLGRLDAARALLNRLHAQKRPDWRSALALWESELAKLHVATTTTGPVESLTVSLMTGDGPVWLPDKSPAEELFPMPEGEPLRVAFLGGSIEGTGREEAVHQLSDAPGRMSRVLPLFLSEQVRFGGRSHVRTLVVRLNGEAPAFVVRPSRWDPEEAARHARAGDKPADYVVVTHLLANAEPWIVEASLVRTIDAKVLGELRAEVSLETPAPALPKLAAETLALLEREAGLTRSEPPEFYRVPEAAQFAGYLMRLEQLLAVRCASAGAKTGSAAFLSGEREILDGNLGLCLAEKTSTVARLLLVETLRYMKRISPEPVAEFRDRATLLQREHPLPAPAAGVVERLFAEVYP